MIGEVGNASAAVDVQRTCARVVLWCRDGQASSRWRLKDGLFAGEPYEALRRVEHYPVDRHFGGTVVGNGAGKWLWLLMSE